ncbi:PAS domain S-box protein [Halopiger goleimassiliensis]|uniref:PAS domain S-box protein n=1 Tax=Halopiger goleimassiliensis TaxID=1293048 RepID=UPI0006776F7C|nr:PAS domain S-box protein [Halopiger goleimassiliensis]
MSDCSLDVRDVLELVPDYAAVALDAAGHVTDWNDGVAQLTGYDRTDALDAHYREVLPADQDDQPETAFERARETGYATDRGWRVRADGSAFWASELFVRIGSAGEVGPEAAGDDATDEGCFGWVIHDRTEERERELDLRREQALSEGIFAAQPDVLYAFDADGNYLAWNDRVPEVTGYSDGELAEMGPLEFVAPEDRSRVADAIERVLNEERQVTVETALLTSDGDRIPYEFNSAPITDDDGTVLGFTGVGRDVSDRKARERELREEKALTESIFAAQPDLLYAYDVDGTLMAWNDRFRELTGADEDELEDVEPLQFIAPEDRPHLRAAIDRILEEGDHVTAEGRVVAADGSRVPYEFNSAPITDDDGTVLGFTGVGRDVSDRKARERELERLERLNGIVRTIDETMVAAETREEIERAIVETFASAAAYPFAVIGRVDSDVTGTHRTWEPRHWEGLEESALETVVSSYVDPPPEAPDASPLENRTVRSFRHLEDSDVGPWRTHARDCGYGAVAVVPIAAGGRAFGALILGASDGDAFSDREREVLQEFGGTVGHAINAVSVRRLLYLDAVVELEFESTDQGQTLVDLSARAGCRLTLDHLSPLTDEGFVFYLTVSDVDADRFGDLAGEHPAVTECRRIDADAESHWELVVTSPTLAGVVADYGARIDSLTVEDGLAEAVIQVSPDVDIRSLVNAVTDRYPDTTLQSKRSVDRPIETHADFRRTVADALTDKQRLALEAAYYGGYFEWPTRSADAGELADRLDIARQTFHQHLRVALEKLLTAYFEGGT